MLIEVNGHRAKFTVREDFLAGGWVVELKFKKNEKLLRNAVFVEGAVSAEAAIKKASPILMTWMSKTLEEK